MEMSIQELLPTTAIAGVGKPEASGGSAPVGPDGVFAEILHEFSTERAIESELGIEETVSSNNGEEEVPLKELSLAPLLEVAESEHGDDEELPVIPVSLEIEESEEYPHNVGLAQEHESTAFRVSARVENLPEHVSLGDTKSAEKVDLSPVGVSASSRAIERVEEVVHAPGARAHNPLIRAVTDLSVLPETVAPEIATAIPKAPVTGETTVPETASATKESLGNVVTEPLREQPLLSKGGEAEGIEATLRIRQETTSTRPTVGQVRVEEVLRDETGHAASVLAASGTPKRIGSPELSGIPIPKPEPVPDSSGSAPFKVSPGISETLAASTGEAGDDEMMVSPADSKTDQQAKVALLVSGSRSNAVVEAIQADTLPQGTSGSPVNVAAPLGALLVEPAVEHVGLRSAEQPALHPPLRSTVSELGGTAIKGVRYLVSGGQESITVRLVPASLGELHLTVKVGDAGLEIELRSASATVRAALEMQLPGLREALAREGIDVAQVTLSESANTEVSAGASERGTHGSEASSRSRSTASAYRNAEPDPGSTSRRKATTTHAGTLDLFV